MGTWLKCVRKTARKLFWPFGDDRGNALELSNDIIYNAGNMF